VSAAEDQRAECDRDVGERQEKVVGATVRTLLIWV